MKFYLHHHNGAIGNQIYIEFFSTKIGGRFIHPTGLYVFPNLWDSKGNWVVRNDSTAIIEAKLRDLESVIKVYRGRKDQSKQELKTLLDESISEPDQVIVQEKTMLQWYDQFLAQRTLVQPSTLRSYTRAKEIFTEFLTDRLKHTIKPSQYTDLLHFQFEAYLKGKYSQNQHAKVVKRLLSFLKFLSKKKVKLDHVSVEDIKYKETSRRKIALKYQEIMDIKDLSFSDVENLLSRERLERLRDIMVSHALTGVRISDLFKLDIDLIIDDEMKIIQQKSKKIHMIYVDDDVKEILMRYGGKLPKYSEQEYRQGIKDVYKKYDPETKIQVHGKDGIKSKYLWEEISSHDMVRTYITIASRHFKISTKSIAETVGKTEKVITKHYLQESEAVARNEFKEKWKSLKKGEDVTQA